MPNSGFELLLWLLRIVVKFQIPVVLFILTVIFYIKIHRDSPGPINTDKLLLTITSFNVVSWVFVYGEHYSDGAILMFDHGAPLLGFASLLVLPVLTIVHIAMLRKSKMTILRADIIAAYLFSLLSMLPGLFLVTYVVAAVMSGN